MISQLLNVHEHPIITSVTSVRFANASRHVMLSLKSISVIYEFYIRHTHTHAQSALPYPSRHNYGSMCIIIPIVLLNMLYTAVHSAINFTKNNEIDMN